MEPNHLIIYGTAWKGDRTFDLVVQALREGYRAFDVGHDDEDYRESLFGDANRNAIREGLIKREKLWVSLFLDFHRL